MFLGTLAFAQPPPADFTLKATVGGVAPWSEVSTITIDSQGNASYTRYNTGGIDSVLAESTFTVSPTNVQRLWKAIQDSSFFSLNSPPPDSTVFDGSFAKITVTANGISHQVLVKNTAQPQIQSLVDSLDAITPPSLRLRYQPPPRLNVIPLDPCNSLFGSAGSVSNREYNTKSLTDPKAKVKSSTYPVASEVVLPHPGTAVSYMVPLSQAVSSKVATLKSKGLFFGDDVSISVDNSIPKPSNTINVTLYLEFWGPLATQANVDRMAASIDILWNGHTTTTGKAVNVEVVTRLNPGASAPPGTPGYHQIQVMAKDAVRANVSGSFGINNGTGAGQWDVGEPPGMYAHEAGHLMGLPDRYDDYQKQPDGSWVNSNGGKRYANDDLFAAYAKSKYPEKDLAVIKAFLKRSDTYSIPQDGSENDLMANHSKPIRQSDIDLITANPGLLVRIPSGAVLVNKNTDDQNIVVTHSEDLFVKAGEKRTLNGIYGACIDGHKAVPEWGGLFDVIPSLESWKGIAAAGYLSQLIHFMDSAGVYCGFSFAAPEAIWRITDNSTSFPDDNVQALFSAAGIHLGDQVLDFPRLTTQSTNDSTSLSFVPDELFAADIQPRFVDGSPGSKATFNAIVSQPVNAGFTTSFSWTANGPDTASVPIAGSGSSGSLTPPRSGMYEVGLNISVTDSALNKRTFKATGKAYVVVPDSVTETFEHAHLADKFPWRTYGNVPWSITGTNPQTGSFAVQAGNLTPHQTSVLAIDLALPTDGTITFSIRTATVKRSDQCQFLIDSILVQEFSGMSDWNVATYPLKAGSHTLAWNSTGPGSTAGKVWLDNVFFPPHSIVTSAGTGPSSNPTAFVLYQNYPNPFNPATVLGFSVPAVSGQSPVVSLRVFDILGREVAVLVNERKAPGSYTVRFDGSRYSSGVYYYRLVAGAFVQTRAMVLTK